MYDPARNSWSKAVELETKQSDVEHLGQPADDAATTATAPAVTSAAAVENVPTGVAAAHSEREVTMINDTSSSKVRSHSEETIELDDPIGQYKTETLDPKPSEMTSSKGKNRTARSLDDEYSEGRHSQQNLDSANDSYESKKDNYSKRRVPEQPRRPSRSPPRKLKRPSSQRHNNHAEREREAAELRRKLDSKVRSHAADDAVRQHYNERPDMGLALRQESPIILLKSFNNFIKSALIGLRAPRGAVVLDLGCGKGGDLQKWKRRNATGLIGVDIAEVSIQQAKERYNQLPDHFKGSCWTDFCVGDPFEETVESIVHPKAFPVDVVSIQFAMHYGWDTEEHARFFLSNVQRALKSGGAFIGTIPNSDFIIEKLESLGEEQFEWGNSIYGIKFEEKPKLPLESDFGNRYSFYLKDAVDNVPEYIVPFDNFVELAKEYSLELLYDEPFLDMFDSMIEEHHFLRNLAQRMRVYKKDGTLGVDGEEREACGVYRAFAFKKL